MEGYGSVSGRRNRSNEMSVSEKTDPQEGPKMYPEVGREYSSLWFCQNSRCHAFFAVPVGHSCLSFNMYKKNFK